MTTPIPLITPLPFAFLPPPSPLPPSSQENELSLISKMYLAWSFLHLLGRLAIVSFTCARVHEESYRGISCVLDIPENRYEGRGGGIRKWRGMGKGGREGMGGAGRKREGKG